MPLQIRVTTGSRTNPVIVDRATGVTYSKSINNSDESISFSLPKVDSKAYCIDPYDSSNYGNLVEVWDSTSNSLLNYGPITGISDEGSSWSVTAAGRSALLDDYYMFKYKTYYASVESVMEKIRFENLLQAPQTQVFVTDDLSGAAGNILDYSIEDQYYAVSKSTKDHIRSSIEDTLFGNDGQDAEPSKVFYTTNKYWTGLGVYDSIMVDFGESVPVSKIQYLFPWWGGPQNTTNRSYDFDVFYANDGATYTGHYEGRSIGDKTHLFSTGDPDTNPSRIVTTAKKPLNLYVGVSLSGTGTELNTQYITHEANSATVVPNPVSMRYLITRFNAVHAWYGNNYDTEPSHDGFLYQCDPDYTAGDDGYFGSKAGLMHGKTFYDTGSMPTPSSDCKASLVSLGVYREIMEDAGIEPLALHKIDNFSPQITYNRTTDASELTSYTVSGIHYKKFEPGAYFTSLDVTWAGASSTMTRFFRMDCLNCYPDGFSFGCVDHNNNAVYMSDDAAGSATIEVGRKTKHLLFRGTSTITLGDTDSWKAKSDSFSYNGAYSYADKTGSTAVLHFRGKSLKWYGSNPDSTTGATVKIEYRYKIPGTRQGSGNLTTEMWSAWSTLEASYKIPDGPYTNRKVWEVTYESGTFSQNTSYEVRITTLDDNHCSIDSFEGYWTGSFVDYAEDNSRISLSNTAAFKQFYGGKFEHGSMYKWNKAKASASFYFEGDRVVVHSAKGRNHGQLTFLLFQYSDSIAEYDPGVDNHIFIPGGDPTDGSYTVNLNTGKTGWEIPNYVAFDSNKLFGDYGLPWGKYTLVVQYQHPTTYTTDKNEQGSESFVYRCKSCNPRLSGKTVTINKYVYLGGISAHEKLGVSFGFTNASHLEVLKSIAEATQMEWSIDATGLQVKPRIGTDTDILLREGDNTLVSYSISNDFQKMATGLLVNGGDVNGVTLSVKVDDSSTRQQFGRTITRVADFRDITSYPQLSGQGWMELRRRSRPEKRISVSHISNSLGLVSGDSFLLWTRKSGTIRVRINRLEINESSGRVYNLECVEWPQIV